MQKNIVVALTFTSALGLAACQPKAPERIPEAPQSTVAPTPSPTTTAPLGPQPGSQAHFAAEMNGADTIYFDTDQFNIDSEDAAALRRQAQYMQTFPAARATVEGHADERGTRDYNLALGERRANAAKNFLVSLGVAESRLRTVSFGEERPQSLGSTDAAWARNRRAVTVLIGQ